MLFSCYVLGLGFRVWVSPNCAVNVTEFLFFPLMYITLVNVSAGLKQRVLYGKQRRKLQSGCLLAFPSAAQGGYPYLP